MPSTSVQAPSPPFTHHSEEMIDAQLDYLEVFKGHLPVSESLHLRLMKIMKIDKEAI